MPDIFISYKKEERAVASQLATRLTEAGYDVWWDAALLAGDRFEDEISTVLRTSRAVIVLWSKLSVASDWVKAEAETARAQKKALPAVIDDLPMDELPLLFRGVHAVRLGGWTGESDHPGYTELMTSVADRLGAAEGPALSVPQAEAKLAQNVSEAEIWSAIAGSTDPSAAEYRSYIKQFGTSARFAELAQIRITRLEAQEGTAKTEIHRKRRNWMPALVLPLIALLIIAGTGGWMWSRGDLKWVGELFIPQAAKEAAQRCADWSKSAKLEWPKMLPVLEDSSAADCDLAKTTWPDNADYKAMMAMVRAVQGSPHNDEAGALARESASAGSALGKYLIGVMYDYGINLEVNLREAAKYYEDAFELGSADAAGRLCLMAEDNGLTLPSGASLDAIYALCSASSNKGSAIGQAMMGYISEYGHFGKPIDMIKAAELYEKSAAQGYAFAKIQLASLLIRGAGIKHDPTRAVALFEEAVALGYPEAMRWLGIAHELGIGVAPDIPRAAQLYQQAIYRSDTIAGFLIGFQPTDRDERGDFTRREILHLATESTPVGLRIFSTMRQYGMYASQSNAAAFASLTKCVDANVFCQLALGNFLRFGPMEYADDPRAVELFQHAADAGEMHAQFQLARIYEEGIDVPRDIARARELYQLAFAQGFSQAGDDLDRLNQAGFATSP